MTDVLVIGGGPAGLAAAEALAKVARVTVIDREAAMGGVPRLCHHTGFGWFDLRRVLSGPAYAARRAELTRAAGATLLAETTAIAWRSLTALEVTGPDGVRTIDARAVLLATGCRERPRAARLVPGTRPAGVLTTGSLQQLVARGIRPGRRALIVGAEHVSFSAALTLAAADVEIAAMITDLPRHQTVRGVALALSLRHRFRIFCGVRVARIAGGARVTAVELDDGRSIACDTVVFTGDWIPDHELARAGGLAIDAQTHGPRVDGAWRTSRPGVFAAGNGLRGAETADAAALEGRAAARAIVAHLDGGDWPSRPVEIAVEAPLAWISPSAITSGTPPRHFVLRVSAFVPRGALEVRQGERVLHVERTPPLVPNRGVTLAADWTPAVARDGGPVTVAYRF